MKAGAAELGLALDDLALKRFELLATRLYEANAVQNLTRIPPEQFLERHALESLHPIWALEHGWKGPIVDVGSGAGFPGLPVKIVYPDVPLVVLDAHSKALDFVSRTVEELGLTDVTCLHGRAEEIAHDPLHRERYGLALCRALGSPEVVAELLAPFLVVGGYAVPHRTVSDPELNERVLEELGLRQVGLRLRGTLAYPIWHKEKGTPPDRPRSWRLLRRLGKRKFYG